MDSQLSKKIRLGRTKGTNIINNVLGPVITNECKVLLNFSRWKYIYVSCNDKNVCILVKYFENCKTVVNLLDVINVAESATLESLYNAFTTGLTKHK
jgi:hypothetical protein